MAEQTHRRVEAREQRLVLVGGPPGVGKTTTCGALYRRLPNSIYIDADDLWCRMNPFRADAVTIPMVERNVAAVLRNGLEAGFDWVILGWVLHREEIVGRLLSALDGLEFSCSWLTLVCDEEALRERWAATHAGDPGVGHALGRLREANQLTRSRRLDTTGLPVEAVVDLALRCLAEPVDPGGARWWRERPAIAR